MAAPHLCTLLAGTLIAAASTAFAAAPPPAPSHPVPDTIFGVTVSDPYRNLEDLKSTETRDWLNAEGEFAEQSLARIDGRAALIQRIAALQAAGGDTLRAVIRMPGSRIYGLRRKAGESQFKLVLRVGRTGTERVLVDPQKLVGAAGAPGVPHAINYFMPSWDGRSLAYGVSAGGSEDASLHVIDIASGKPLIAPIPRVHDGLIHWSPDSRTLSYNQLRELPANAPDTEFYLDSTVFAITPRGPAAAPRALFGPLIDATLKLDRLDVGEVIFAPGSRYMIARTTDTTSPEGRLFVAPLAALGQTRIDWQSISTAADKIVDIGLRGDTLYLQSQAGAPRGRVLALPLADPVLAHAVEIVPQPVDGALQHVELGREAVYAEVYNGFATRVLRYAGAQPGSGVDIAPAVTGTVWMVADPAHIHSDAWIVNESWSHPERMLVVDGGGGTRDTELLTARQPPGTPEIEVTEVLVPSHDGAQVPLSILRRKGLALSGDNPTLLIGYGAYGVTLQAGFDPANLAWLERGGVIAYANVRGSGAFGEEWHLAGAKANKPNTWKDGIACARWLIDQRYASPATLGIWGTSAGGIFVGRAVTSAPALFAAAIFDVGIMDAVRAEESANGITNISEFGTAKRPDEFAALLEMSTYHHIVDGTAYPAVMLIHGLNDPRVDVWHSAKVAARLQAASSSGKPILLRLDGQAGHGIGSTAEQRASKLADIYAFLLWQFGKTGLAP